jgi:hypothetical protein
VPTYDGEVSRLRLVAAAALAAALLASCSGDEASPIQVAAVGRADVAEVVEAPGVVTAKATATVNAPADGRVEALEVATEPAYAPVSCSSSWTPRPRGTSSSRPSRRPGGRRVRPGQHPRREHHGAAAACRRGGGARVRARAHRGEGDRRPHGPGPGTHRRGGAEAQYEGAQAQARADVRRFNAGLGSVADALGSLSQAQRVQTKAAVAVARRTVKALTVRAPISGVVSYGGGSAGSSSGDLSGALGQLPESVRGQAGSLLGGSGAAAERWRERCPRARWCARWCAPDGDDLSTLAVTAEVDETDVLLVRKGVKADVELDAVPGASYAASVSSVAVSPTTSARGGVSYGVRLALGGGQAADGSPAPVPRPGMSAVVRLKVRAADQAVAVPASGVFRDGARDAVWVVGADGTAKKRLVSLGAQGEAMVEVSEGLGEGERIVVRGADQVTEGLRVP